MDAALVDAELEGRFPRLGLHQRMSTIGRFFILVELFESCSNVAPQVITKWFATSS